MVRPIERCYLFSTIPLEAAMKTHVIPRRAQSYFPLLVKLHMILLLFSLTLSSCSAQDEDDAKQNKQKSSVENEVAEDDLMRAKRIVDRGIKVLKANPDATWDEMKPKLIKVMNSEPVPYLSEEETITLQEYLKKEQETIKPLIDRLNESRKKVSGSVATRECTTYCILFFLMECDTDCLVGICFGIWGCESNVVVNDCDECIDDDSSPCREDGDCPPGYRCAKWVFKKNECVKTCESNGDCPPGQKCKRPFGTSFKRCK